MNKYTLFQKAKNRYAPWPIEDVDDFFINTLKAKSLSLYDKDLEPFLIEHEIPQREKIGGVYGVYDLAITALLNGKVKSVNDMAFQQLSQKAISLTDTDTILTIGSLVILKTDDFETVSGCYIGGTINRLYNLVAFFAGLPEVDKMNFENYIIDDYLSSLADVKTMGFFEL
ncbi:MAG: Nitroreductase [Shouchella clausii]